MLKGPWGAGKTHLVKSFIGGEDYTDKFLYVSLYGVTTYQQIEDAFFRQLHPLFSSKGMKIAGQLVKGFAKGALKIDIDGDGKTDASINISAPDLSIPSFLSKSGGRILVFDDLERCSIKIDDILGYINSYVEHEGHKCIVISNEKEIKEEGRYLEIKEKLIGKTLEVQSDFNIAVPQFISEHPKGSATRYLKSNIDEIRILYRQFNRHNLRALKQSLWDFQRFSEIIPDKYWKNVASITIVFRLFMALSLEHKAANLDETDIEQLDSNDFSRYLGGSEDPRFARIEELEKKYVGVRLGAPTISSELLKDLIFKGLFDSHAILKALQESPLFEPSAPEPAWKRAWFGFERTDDDFEAAVDEMEDDFKNRRFLEPGEIYHVFGLRIYFSSIGAIPYTKSRVLKQCKEYVDDLKKSGNIPNALIRDTTLSHWGGWGGLQIQGSDTKEYQEAAKYYGKSIEQHTQSQYPALAQDLLDKMKSNTIEYMRMICVNSDGPSPYYNIPILSAIKPQDFVDSLLNIEAEAQRTALSAFEGRYQAVSITKELSKEGPWIKKVSKLIRREIPNLRVMSKHRLEVLLNRYIDPIIAKLDASKSP
jgi:hypothetical protein